MRWALVTVLSGVVLPTSITVWSRRIESQSLIKLNKLACHRVTRGQGIYCWDRRGQAGTRRRTTDRSTIQIKFFRSSTVDLIRSPGGTEKESMVMFQVVPLTGTAAAASCNPLYYYYYLSIRHAIQCQFMTPKNKCTSYTRDHVSLSVGTYWRTRNKTPIDAHTGSLR